MSPPGFTPLKVMKTDRAANLIAAGAPALKDPIVASGLTVEELRSDDVQLAIIELSLVLILLDPKANAPSKVKAADKLASIKGLDKNSQADEKLSAIMKLRDRLALDIQPIEKKMEKSSD